MSPEVKGYAYCHTFCGHELKLRVLENVTFRPLTRWFKAVVPSDVRIGVERAKSCFFSFPKRPVERRSRWIAAVRREGWQPNQHSRICSAHFVTGKVVYYDPTHTDYILTVFVYNKQKETTTTQTLARNTRLQRRNHLKAAIATPSREHQ